VAAVDELSGRMHELIGGPFAAVLEARRSGFNARFEAARRRTPALDRVAFGEHLVQVVAPIVEAVAARGSAHVSAVAEALYDLSLELFTIGVLGPAARYPAVTRGWRRLLSAHPAAVAADPRRLTSALTNALINLSQVPGVQPYRWIDGLLECAALQPTPAEILAAGQVVAWRVGMAHFRQATLDRCQTLSPALTRVALGLLPDARAESASLDVVLARLQADPWLDPVQAALPNITVPRPILGLVARVGGFRGFGGVFLRPPRVESSQSGFILRDGYQDWLLVADHFGATFHRTAPSPLHASVHPDDSVFPDGRVSLAGHTGAFPSLAGAKSWATDAARRTLAVTMPHSHTVALVALVNA
jgi:hypothetical protein